MKQFKYLNNSALRKNCRSKKFCIPYVVDRGGSFAKPKRPAEETKLVGDVPCGDDFILDVRVRAQLKAVC